MRLLEYGSKSVLSVNGNTNSYWFYERLLLQDQQEDFLMAKKPTYEQLEQRVKDLEKETSERKLTEKLAWVTSYREIFDAVKGGIFVHDKETGAILDVNEKAASFADKPEKKY